jgi:hypothetical protein
MKSKKQLQKIFNNAKGDNKYYSFEAFTEDARNFLKDMRKRKIISSIYVSKSGMLRRFNVLSYKMLLNICYNNKKTWDDVVVKGCGMDMYFHLLYSACNILATKKEIEKYGYNSLSSYQKIL